jgi:hypothetical protein
MHEKVNNLKIKQHIFLYLYYFYFSALTKPLCSVQYTKYHSGDQIKKIEMGRACNTYWGEKLCIQDLGGET